MSDEQLRIAVAEACGFREIRERGWSGIKDDARINVPNFPASLDAMHEVEKTLTEDQKAFYLDALLPNDANRIPYRELWFFAHATARQRCLAYLATMPEYDQDDTHRLRDKARRWTAPQAGTGTATESKSSPERIDFIVSGAGKILETRPSEPASWAVPITPETVVPLPNWSWHSRAEEWHHCKHRLTNPGRGMLNCGYTFYHPDQPTAPTCRPTATEGGKV